MPHHNETLIKQAAEGDHESFDKLFEPLRARLRSFLSYTLGNIEDAREAENETMLRCAGSLRKIQPDTTADAWLFSIGRNVAREKLRLRARDRRLGEKLRELEPRAPFEMGSEDLLLSRKSIQRKLVVEALDSIPPRQKRMVMLRLFSGYGFREAGEKLGVGADAAKMLYFRAVQSLRKVLKQKGVFDE